MSLACLVSSDMIFCSFGEIREKSQNQRDHKDQVNEVEMASAPKLSGLQKQVLELYRKFLRAARSKGPDEREKIEAIISAEFRHNAKSVDRKNFIYIEYLLRRGKRQLDQLCSPGTVALSTLQVDLSSQNKVGS